MEKGGASFLAGSSESIGFPCMSGVGWGWGFFRILAMMSAPSTAMSLLPEAGGCGSWWSMGPGGHMLANGGGCLGMEGGGRLMAVLDLALGSPKVG